MPAIRTLAAFVCVAAFCASLHAQTDNTIQILLRDGKTGLPVTASNYLVRINHDKTVHNEWVHIADDGTVTVTLPEDAKEISIKATYNMSMDTYINCDAAKESDKEREIWYSVADILKTGIVAPNECSKTSYKPQPGQFTFFARKRSWHDSLDQ